MAIYTERIIKVNNNTAAMDKDIYVYRGNRNIEIQFKIIDYQFKFKDVNLVEQISPSHAYVTLLTPQMKQISTGKAEVIDGTIKLIITSAMIDEKTECGDYTIVVDLYDEIGDSLITIPPVENQLHVLDRMTDIDDVPDELRFVFDEVTGNLEVVNIDVNYDETTGEIKTIENIPLQDRTARRLIDNLEADFEELDRTVDDMSIEMIPIKTEINRLSPIVDKLVDSGYSQIKSTMLQSEIQNVLNDGGLILFRSGVYNITEPLNILSNTNILVESKVEINTSINNVIKLNNIENVNISGNIIVNGSGVTITNCNNIIIDNLSINESENGITLTGGNDIIINNLTTKECRTSGCVITNGTSTMNVVINNHKDIQSLNAININTSSDIALPGRINIIKSLYKVSDGIESCIKINNSINAPRIFFDNPTIQVDNNKEVVLSIVKEDGNSQMIGNIEINNPCIIGSGNIDTCIKMNNNMNSGALSKIKIFKPEVSVNNKSYINLIGNVQDNRSIIIDLDESICRDLSENISISEDLCSIYTLPSSINNNINVTLDCAPVNFECKFMNKSDTRSLNISGIINDKTSIELKYNDYMHIKHMGNNKWIILDENFKEKMLFIYANEDKLYVKNARYQNFKMTSDINLVLPNVEGNINEIHLFIKPTDSFAISYPEGIKWTNSEPTLEADGVYEFILTYIEENWLIGCVSYV